MIGERFKGYLSVLKQDSSMCFRFSSEQLDIIIVSRTRRSDRETFPSQMQHAGRPQNLKPFMQDPSVYDLMTLLYQTEWTTPSPAAAVGSTPFAPGGFLAFRF